MIEVASYPEDLGTWDRNADPFYLELFGETRPRVDLSYGEVQPAGADDADPQTAGPTKIYQYWWTIGHDGGNQTFWSRLQDDPAARVYMYFPLDKGWRIKELVATVKYLQPYLERLSPWERIANDLQNVVVPAAAGVGGVVSAIPPLAGAGAALSAIGKVQVNSIAPDTPGFSWSVSKVANIVPEYGAMQGVMWRLPKKMFVDLGSRLTGSLALSFVPSHRQEKGVVASGTPIFEQGVILAHAEVRQAQNNTFWAPPAAQFVELQVAPFADEGSAKPGLASGVS